MNTQSAKVVPVYRRFQPFLKSPCELGDPCEVCVAHQHGKKTNTLCPRSAMTEPAFKLKIKEAVTWVRAGLAVFIHSHRALQLTFSKNAQLRDQSLKIEEQ